MKPEILRLTLGPLQNNTYVVADPFSAQCVIIDPSFNSQVLLTEIQYRRWKLIGIWCTHAHFDHIAGVQILLNSLPAPVPVALHPLDLPIWNDGGGARQFGLDFMSGPTPTLALEAGQRLKIGEVQAEVRFTPGHSPGHVVFYFPSAGAVVCGDLIFRRSVGRTDLSGGDMSVLLQSIQREIFTLPKATRLLPGHGEETTVELELTENPYV